MEHLGAPVGEAVYVSLLAAADRGIPIRILQHSGFAPSFDAESAAIALGRANVQNRTLLVTNWWAFGDRPHQALDGQQEGRLSWICKQRLEISHSGERSGGLLEELSTRCEAAGGVLQQFLDSHGFECNGAYLGGLGSAMAAQSQSTMLVLLCGASRSLPAGRLEARRALRRRTFRFRLQRLAWTVTIFGCRYILACLLGCHLKGGIFEGCYGQSFGCTLK